MSKASKSTDEFSVGKAKRRALSLFSGAGGMDRGFEAAGFEIKAQVEMWKPACETLRANFPEARVIEGDATDPGIKAKVAEMLKDWSIDVVFGGPPCPGFSLLGKRNPKDRRNRLVLEFLKYVAMARPKVFVMENVQGLLSMQMPDGSIAIEAIKAAAARIGYKVEPRVLCAAGYGVAQLRERVIITGTCFDVPILFPEPTHGPEGSGLKPYVTVKEVLDDLRDRPEDKAFGHVFTRHSTRVMKRIKSVKPGETLYTGNHGFRLDPNKPTPTLTNNNGSTVIHYALHRMVTARECSRLQSFGDDHIFCGGKNDVGKQLGNAVPPPMAQAVAGAVLRMLAAIDAGAPELDPSALAPAPVAPAPDAEAMKDAVAKDRKSCVGRINVEQEKIDAAGGRVDSVYLRMGKLIDEHIRAAKALGETRGDDYLLKAIAKDPACKVKHGALYNARSYHVMRSAMAEKYGEAPDATMTDFVKVRHKALTLDEQHEMLLLVAKDKDMTAAKLGKLVGEKLKLKGFGRKDPAPDAEMFAHCNKAFAAVTKVAGLVRKGIVPTCRVVSLMSKTSALLSKCLGGAAGPSPVVAPAFGEGAAKETRAA